MLLVGPSSPTRDRCLVRQGPTLTVYTLKAYSEMRWTVHSLNTSRGTTLEEFLDGLSGGAAAETEALLEMLEEHGNKLRLPISKPLGNGLFEARGLTTGVRLFFVFAPGHRIIVLDGYVKKRTSIPAKIMARIRKPRRTLRQRRTTRIQEERALRAKTGNPNTTTSTRMRNDASCRMESEHDHATFPHERSQYGRTSRSDNNHQRTCLASLAEAAEPGTGRTYRDQTLPSRVRSNARHQAGRTRHLSVSHRAEVGCDSTNYSRLFSGHVQNIELRTMVRVAEVLNSDLELVSRPR